MSPPSSHEFLEMEKAAARERCDLGSFEDVGRGCEPRRASSLQRLRKVRNRPGHSPGELPMPGFYPESLRWPSHWPSISITSLCWSIRDTDSGANWQTVSSHSAPLLHPRWRGGWKRLRPTETPGPRTPAWCTDAHTPWRAM